MDNIKELLDYVKTNDNNDFLYKKIFDLVLLKLRKLEKQNHYITILVKRNNYKILSLGTNAIPDNLIKTIKYLGIEYLIDDFDIFYPPIDSELILDVTDYCLYEYYGNYLPTLPFMYNISFIDYSKLNSEIEYKISLDYNHKNTLEGCNFCNLNFNEISIIDQPKLNKIIFNKIIAPKGTFIDSASDADSIPGYEATEPKKIIVPTGATGYDQGGWKTLIDNGWTIEYSDELAAELNSQTTT